MTRGNQRELARKKNMKKQADTQKKKKTEEGNGGARLQNRQERDADIMRQKQAKAQADQKPGGATGGK